MPAAEASCVPRIEPSLGTSAVLNGGELSWSAAIRAAVLRSAPHLRWAAASRARRSAAAATWPRAGFRGADSAPRHPSRRFTWRRGTRRPRSNRTRISGSTIGIGLRLREVCLALRHDRRRRSGRRHRRHLQCSLSSAQRTALMARIKAGEVTLNVRSSSISPSTLPNRYRTLPLRVVVDLKVVSFGTSVPLASDSPSTTTFGIARS